MSQSTKSSSSSSSSSCRVIQTSLTICLCLLIISSTCLADSLTSLLSRSAEKPNFIPCELAQLALGINKVNVPGFKFVPCTLVRGAKYFSGHYKRGLRMLMKNSRKNMSRSKFLNSLGTQKKSSVSVVASKLAGNVATRIVSGFKSKI